MCGQYGVVPDEEEARPLLLREERLEVRLRDQDAPLENRGLHRPFDLQPALRVENAVADLLYDDPLKRPRIDRRAAGMKEYVFARERGKVAAVHRGEAGLQQVRAIRPIRLAHPNGEQPLGERRIVCGHDRQQRLRNITPSEAVLAPHLDAEPAYAQRPEETERQQNQAETVFGKSAQEGRPRKLAQRPRESVQAQRSQTAARCTFAERPTRYRPAGQHRGEKGDEETQRTGVEIEPLHVDDAVPGPLKQAKLDDA